MEIYRHHKLTLELHNEEADGLREILRLAHDRLNESPKVQMKGSPLERQSGLVGPELFRVKSMLEKLGVSLGIDLPYEPAPKSGSDDKCVIGQLLILNVSAGTEVIKS